MKLEKDGSWRTTEKAAANQKRLGKTDVTRKGDGRLEKDGGDRRRRKEAGERRKRPEKEEEVGKRRGSRRKTDETGGHWKWKRL